MSVEKLGSVESVVAEQPELQVEHEKREVARVFVLQSRSSDQISSEIGALAEASQAVLAGKIAHLPLTHCLWLEKGSGSRNEGQIMPIGGGIEPEDKGDLNKTASRELLQETHLRPTSLHQLRTLDEKDQPITIDYKMRLKGKDQKVIEVDNTQHLYVATILPSDVPYQLDPKEDKIAEFPGLSLEEMGTLWGENKVTKKHPLKLLDSLQLFPQNSSSAKIDLEFGSIENHTLAVSEVMRSLGAEARSFKIQKMADVACELIAIWEWKMKENTAISESEIATQIESAQTLVREMKGLEDRLPEAEKLYAQIIAAAGQDVDLTEWFAHAVERSNFKEELKNPGNSDIEAAVRLAFLLTETSLSLREVADLQKSQLEEIGHTVQNEYYDLIGFLQRVGGVIDIEDLTDDVLAEYANTTPRKQIDVEVASRTGISNIATKFNRLNKFLENMIEMGLVRGSKDTLEPGQVNMLTNVANADLRSLLRYAFDTSSEDIKEKFQTTESRKRLQFESLRKLFLLSALEPASRRYQEAESLGNHDVEDLWGNLLVINERSQRSVVTDDGHGGEVVRFMRGFQNIPGLLAVQDVRTKQLSSYFRKIIVRGFDNPEQLWDIYGRSLVLAADPEADAQVQHDLFTRQAVDLPVFVADKQKGLQPEIKTVFEYPAVIRIIQELQAQGAKIVDYDPTNLPGTNFNSAGPGGGDPIVLAKFYICLDTESGGETERRFEEVQIFSPTEDGVSGFQHKEQKAQFDAEYTIRRLTDTKGLRSFIELMFPAGIYGDPMHAPYRKALKDKNGNGNGHSNGK